MLNTLLKNDLVHLFVDHNKNIFNIEVLSSEHTKENKEELVEYIKNFWIFVEASEQKYHIIINVHNLGFYHIGIFDDIIKLLKSLEPIFINHQHSSCLILKSDNLFSRYSENVRVNSGWHLSFLITFLFTE